MSYHWSTHQLTEYFAAVSSPDDEQAAIMVALERAAEALDAEVCAVVLDGELRGCVGIGRSTPPEEITSLSPGLATLTVPVIGPMNAIVADLGAPGPTGRSGQGLLMVARTDEQFVPEEQQMLQGMARVLGLVLRSLRTLAAERARHQLLETLLAIQRAISNRKPLQEVLDAVTAGASGLLGGAVISLVLSDPLNAGQLIVASTFGHEESGGGHPVALAAAAEAMSADQLVTHPDEATGGSLGVIAAPVHVSGRIAGSLVARSPGGGHGGEQRELLAAFAQQVSMALTDARTVEAMREAYHDSLTGLPNRALFLDRLEHAREVAGRRGEGLTVLFIDLDRFKSVNDSLGHRAGDELLAAVAERLRGCLRASDTAARLGGDEFAVLLEGAAVEDGVRVANGIIAAVSEPFRVAGRDIFIGASIGVAPDRSRNADAGELLSNADVAMYRAKRAGSGRTAVFEPHMHDEVVNHLNLASYLQRALSFDEMSLQYQPLIRLDSGEPVGVEALLRWTHPHRGSVPPSTFIPIAEETDVILELGRWVLWNSARQVSEWRLLNPGLTLNVNISPRQVMDARFVVDIADVLDGTGLPAEALTLELTETLLLVDPEAAWARLIEAKEMGVRLSVDDFGTGYASLSYLRRFPVDQVKIDPSFISELARHEGAEQDLAVVRAIVDLSRSLRLDTVAEGIETAEQLEALRGLGCALGQGYHLARPLDPPDAEAYLSGASPAEPAARTA
jgi:diguanylate cyclase (GGDEF)-like protein